MARPPTYESPVKLTLYVETSVRDEAQKIAKAMSLSTSALFSKLVKSHAEKDYVAPIKKER